MTDEHQDRQPGPIDRRTLRLTFRSTADGLRLVGKERLDMICPPAVGEPPAVGRNSGFWVELQDQGGTARFFRVLHDPLRASVEVHAPDGTIRREFGPGEETTFEVLVPDDRTATTVVVVGDTPTAEHRDASTGSHELARFDLASGDPGEGDDTGAPR